ncbi:O-fucosyltransferase family protein [Rhynchospora pubera]|uniref:O-fucosyltransferase family protein n=2 Tax=Rhynchospora pubera TaxID=906938 RepID=A0AAV8HIX9_9POAL|nr:O-fucosyltransferase family protein [Rhynchospora pubera]
MAVDPRQLVAGFLTISMFVMVGNMIKRDHFDTIEVSLSDSSRVQVNVIKVEEKKTTQVAKISTIPVKTIVSNKEIVRQCWVKPLQKPVASTEGFVTFSLTTGPEFHISQVTDAVVIASQLGASLVLPTIRGNEGRKRNFQYIYDAQKFTTSLDGIVKVIQELPQEYASKKPTIIRVPNRVTKEFISKTIKPIFETNKFVHLSIVFPSITLKKRDAQNGDFIGVACQAMFQSLQLRSDLLEVAETMIEKLKVLSIENGGQLVAIDFRSDMLNKKSCMVVRGRRKSCYNASEVAEFLKKLRFNANSVVYLTETWWHGELNPLKEAFPRTYTKDDIIPAEKKRQFLQVGNRDLQKALDFHICSNSDTFVPAISGLFYGNVAGQRIISGRTQILVPSQVVGSPAAPSDFMSAYVSKKSHLAYSCLC